MIDDVRSFAVTGSGRRLNPSGTENREEREEKEGCDERRERDLECRIVHNTVCEYTTLHYSTVGVIMYRFLLSSSCRHRRVVSAHARSRTKVPSSVSADIGPST